MSLANLGSKLECEDNEDVEINIVSMNSNVILFC
jgi:hypothetical protein